MKPVQFTFAIVIASVLQMANAHAQTSPNDTYISCGPRIPFVGEKTSIVIKKGAVDALPAEFTQGRDGNVTTVSSVVQKTESNDFRIEFYNGPGLVLTVDLTKNSANLTAVVNGEKVKLTDLVCLFNENDPAPGVTMGN